MSETRTSAPLGEPVDAAPALRPSREIRLEGRHVVLVPLDPAVHGDALYEGAHGPEAEDLWRYLFQTPFPDRAAFRAHLDAAARGDDPFFLAILDKATGRAVGQATYMRIDAAHRVIEVGNILYTPALQRTPGGTEAMYLMARHAFEDLGYRRYEWKCNALNAPSRRAAARYGFAFEGVFRRHMIVKGRNRDTAWFSMIEEEWPARRQAFERWLAPGNFDAQGRQHLALGALNAEAIPGVEGLRRARPGDRDAFAALQAAAYAPNRPRLGVEPLPLAADPASVIAGRETWLLEDASGLAGALVLEPSPEALLVWSVATSPERQGAGLGTRLMRAAEARARALGLHKLALYTGEPLTRTVAWYERLGYAIGRVEALPDRRIVQMTKNIG
jgi:RimJ/RimL family protein N-acetyltransferase